MVDAPKPISQQGPRSRFVDPRTYHSHAAGPGAAPAPTDPGAGLKAFAGSDLGKWYAGLDTNYQKYMDTLSGSIDRQRGQLDATLASALGSLGQRRDAAASAYTALPGQLQGNDAYGMGQRDQYTNQGLEGLSGDTAARFGGRINQGRVDADAQRTADNQFEAGLQPMLEAANTANYTVGQDRLNAEHLAGVNGLEQQRAAGELQMQAAKAQQDNSLQMALLQRGWQVADRNFGAAQDAAKAGLQPSGIPGLTTAAVNKVKETDAYNNWAGIINKLSTNPQATAANEWGVYANAFGAMPADQRAVLLAENPEFAQLLQTWAQGQGEGENIPSGYNPATQEISAPEQPWGQSFWEKLKTANNPFFGPAQLAGRYAGR